MRVQDHLVTVEMRPKRSQKIVSMLEDLLASNHLSHDEAQRLAGKLGFMAITLFGGMGMAAIQPFYARAHCLGEQENNQLMFASRASVNILKQLMQDTRPRTFSWHVDDVTHKPSSTPTPSSRLVRRSGALETPRNYGTRRSGNPRQMDGDSWQGSATRCFMLMESSQTPSSRSLSRGKHSST